MLHFAGLTNPIEIRNIAIIAHVDHGKTTLTDSIMRQTGMFQEGQSMDVNDLERERGITIYAKNTALLYRGTKINIVDTPGHADFGSEVERVLRSIDSVVLVVDAKEGPMPQTRFVLKKSLELGIKPIVVINKIDTPAADPDRVEEEVLELFFELGANDQQLDFTTVFTIAKQGIAKRTLTEESTSINPLLDVILEEVPPAASNTDVQLRAQPFNLAYDNFLGRMAIARVYEGVIQTGGQVFVKKPSGEIEKGKITALFTFHGISRKETGEATAGDIVMLAGLPEIMIGDTVCVSEDQELLPSIKIDEPTITLNFLVNDSPFAGRDGKLVTSRQIRERLMRELEVNVGLQVDFVGTTSSFPVRGRGELHVSILLENMRREGYEVQVSQPQVIIKEEGGTKLEPFEEVIIDVPIKDQGTVIEKMNKRVFRMITMSQHENTVRLIFEGPTRGLLGYRGEFVVDTRGLGILSSRVIGFKPYAGDISKRATGAMMSIETGKAAGFALWNLQERGALYIGPNTEVYEGMVIGNTTKGDAMTVNPIKGKRMSNMRASGSDEAIVLTPFLPVTIERGLEIMTDDEFLEVTPHFVRLRKQFLKENDRIKAKRGK